MAASKPCDANPVGVSSIFAIVFECGFVLGTIRTLGVVPRIGTRSAELLETPIMLVVSIMAARWTVVRLAVPWARSPRLLMGGMAVAQPYRCECAAGGQPDD